MNKQIMEKPKDRTYGRDLRSCHISIWNGKEILSRFYDQGSWHKNYISHILDEKNWKPNENDYYKVWWYDTNPSDTSDPGNDILFYIEYYNIWMDRPKLRDKIIEKLYTVNDNKLLNIAKELNIDYE